MHSPLVTVVIPSYNHARFVGAAIDSVLAQTLSDFELIVIDDGSKDDSVATIQRRLSQLNDDRARLVARENRGLCRTLNEGLLMARGRYFAYLGSDDLWEPTKVQKQVDLLESAGENAAASFTDCHIIDQDTKRLDRFGRQYRYHGGDIYRDLVRLKFVPPSPTNLFVREKLIFAGGFNESLPIEDYNAWLRLSRYYRVVYVPETLASFRVHKSNTSTNYPGRMFATSLESLQWAFKVDPSLTPLRRRIMGRLNAHDAAAYYNALNFREARRKATKALCAYPFDSLAWRILIRSLLGPLVIRRLRGFRTGRLMSRGQLP